MSDLMDKLVNDLIEISNSYGFLIGYLEASEETTNPKLSVVLNQLRTQDKFPKSKKEKIRSMI